MPLQDPSKTAALCIVAELPSLDSLKQPLDPLSLVTVFLFRSLHTPLYHSVDFSEGHIRNTLGYHDGVLVAETKLGVGIYSLPIATFRTIHSFAPSFAMPPMSMPRMSILSIKEGDHLVNVEEEELPYVYKRVLGQGHTSWVEEVEDKLTNEVFARKRLPIVRCRRAERAEAFQNEIAIIRGLDRHHHIIRVFATYVTSTSFGLISQPVSSDGDLHAYLAVFKDLSDKKADTQTRDLQLESMTAVLHRAFGCLTAGLAFMHDKKIRHKDVKPQNILVHEGRMIYTDFGYSYDFSGFVGSTSEGAPNALTKRYSSPELLMHEPRNSKSDVFALGCVLVEMLTSLTRDEHLEDLIHAGFALAILDDIHHHLSLMEHATYPVRLIETIRCMTQGDSLKRVGSLQASIELLQLPGFCCEQCRIAQVSL